MKTLNLDDLNNFKRKVVSRNELDGPVSYFGKLIKSYVAYDTIDTVYQKTVLTCGRLTEDSLDVIWIHIKVVSYD
jgi:hypothetical protein